MRVLIVDDEESARTQIKLCLAASGNFQTEEAVNGGEALQKLESGDFSLVFLDIEMPGLSGFEVLAQIPRRGFRVIFQTAFDDFAIRAFEENASDYLLKPFTQQRFDKALERAMSSIDVEKKLEALENSLERSGVYLGRLSVKQGVFRHIIDVEDILFIRTEGHYSFVVTSEGEYVSEVSLRKLSQKLDPKTFFQSHRNYLVNMRHVQKIRENGAHVIALKDCEQDIPLAKRNRSLFKSIFALGRA